MVSRKVSTDMYKSTPSLILALVVIAPLQLLYAEVSLKQYNVKSVYKCPPPDNTDEELCKKPMSNTDSLSFAEPIFPDSQQIDIRPKNCRSFFDDYLNTRRGLRIESALEKSHFYALYQNTVTSFPVIDFINNGIARVVKTRDLASDSFNNPQNENALFEQIIRDAKDVHERFFQTLENDGSISATVHGKTTTIKSGEINKVYLDFVVQTGMASQSQIKQIERAKKEIYRRWGYELQLLEIP